MQLYWGDSGSAAPEHAPWSALAPVWVAMWHTQPQALILLWVLWAGASMGSSWLGAPGWALCATEEVRGTEPCCPCASGHRCQVLRPQSLPRAQAGLATWPRLWALNPALVLSSATLQAPPAWHWLPGPMPPK